MKTAHILINQGHVSSFSMLSLSTQSNGGAENQNTMKTPAQDSTHPSVSVSRSVRFQCHSVKGLVQATMTMTKPIFLIDTADCPLHNVDTLVTGNPSYSADVLYKYC